MYDCPPSAACIWRTSSRDSPASPRLSYFADDAVIGELKRLALTLLVGALCSLPPEICRLYITPGEPSRRPPVHISSAPSLLPGARRCAVPLSQQCSRLRASTLSRRYAPWGRRRESCWRAGVRAIAGCFRPCGTGERNARCGCRPPARRIAPAGSRHCRGYAPWVLTEASRAFLALALSVVQSFASITAFAALLIGSCSAFHAQDAATPRRFSRHARSALNCRWGVIAIVIIAAACSVRALAASSRAGADRWRRASTCSLPGHSRRHPRAPQRGLPVGDC